MQSFPWNAARGGSVREKRTHDVGSQVGLVRNAREKDPQKEAVHVSRSFFLFDPSGVCEFPLAFIAFRGVKVPNGGRVGTLVLSCDSFRACYSLALRMEIVFDAALLNLSTVHLLVG